MNTKIVRRICWILTTLVGLVALLVAPDYCSRFSSWSNLSAETVDRKARRYLDSRAMENYPIKAVCVYVLSCDHNEARLKLVRDFDEVDFEALRDQIWARRFRRTCEGRTANLGLHIYREPSESSSRFWHSDHAIWSFNNNRFVPKHGRFSGGSFSEEPWERCSPEKATYFLGSNDPVNSE